MDTNKIFFSEDFVWGVAASSYQIEGAFDKDGRGKSIWDTFSHTKGKIFNDDNGDTAINHYSMYKEDIALMKELNIKSYRFSIAWPRVLPEGFGGKNNKGIDFYKRVVEELLNAGIKPMATLNHWDLPQNIQDKGGWTNRETINYFEEYANLMFNELSGLVFGWITHNEPWVEAFLGNLYGEHAPGNKDWNKALRVAHNLLLSHGKVVRIHRNLNLESTIGISVNLTPSYPHTDDGLDVISTKNYDGFINRWFLDPLFKGEYPQDILNQYNNFFDTSFILQDDLNIISTPIDFLGINYYTRAVVKHSNENELNYRVINLSGVDKTEMGWEIYPEGLHDILLRIKKDYGNINIYITENGAAFNDNVDKDEKISDKNRIDFLRKHLTSLHAAIKKDVQVKGYYLWSFSDNFEWAHGYSKRFGIVFVDYKNLTRIIKESGYWYKNVISNNGY